MLESKLAQLLAFLKVDYLLSDERERIADPICHKGKLDAFKRTLQDCCELAKAYQGKLESDDPEFPKGCHLIQLVLPTENDEIILRELKTKLADAIESADEINIDTDLKGNVRFYFGFEDIYTHSPKGEL